MAIKITLKRTSSPSPHFFSFYDPAFLKVVTAHFRYSLIQWIQRCLLRPSHPQPQLHLCCHVQPDVIERPVGTSKFLSRPLNDTAKSPPSPHFLNGQLSLLAHVTCIFGEAQRAGLCINCLRQMTYMGRSVTDLKLK